MIQSVKQFIEEWESGTSFLEVHTSGSTGTPKLIRLPRKLVIDSAMRSITHFGLDGNSRVHICLSTDHIAGKMAVIRALLSGARLTAEAPSSEPRIGSDEGPVTLLSVVAAQIPSLVAKARAGNLPPIKHLLIGGAPLTESIAGESLGIAEYVWESYGMTETASHIALRHISRCGDVAEKPFTLLPGIKIDLDERGCLRVCMDGEPPLTTNDIAKLHSIDTFSILGRIDNVIITGGLKVHPEHVEQILQPLLSGIGSYIITSQPHPKWGNLIILMIESGEELSIDKKSRLLDAAARLLPPHERPRDIITVSELPRTSSEKIIRRLSAPQEGA